MTVPFFPPNVAKWVSPMFPSAKPKLPKFAYALQTPQSIIENQKSNMLSRPSSLLAVALLAVVARGQTAAGPDPYGLDRQKGSLTLTGSATVHGAKQKFELTFDREFRYQLDGRPIGRTPQNLHV
jgi:hypothetical protein